MSSSIVLNAAILLPSDTIPFYLDPEGNCYKRDCFQRLFTITIPQNGPYALLFWLNRIVAWEKTFKKQLLMITSIFILSIGTAKILEYGRWLTACAIYYSIPCTAAKEIAGIVGPRDFYAKKKPCGMGGASIHK